MNNVKLFIATPMYGNLCCGDYALSIFNLLVSAIEKNIPIKLHTVYNDALITRARNELVSNFLETDFTHLIFIDGDISFNANDVFTMIETDLDIIGGAYSQKAIDWDLVKKAVLAGIPSEDLKYFTGYLNFNHLETKYSFDIDKPLRVKHVPTGFMLIKRSVFEKLDPITPSYKSYDYKGNFEKETKKYFDTDISDDEKIYNSEDWYFCDKWHSIGGEVYIAPWVELVHYGTYPFHGIPVPENIFHYNENNIDKNL